MEQSSSNNSTYPSEIPLYTPTSDVLVIRTHSGDKNSLADNNWYTYRRHIKTKRLVLCEGVLQPDNVSYFFLVNTVHHLYTEAIEKGGSEKHFRS